MQPDPHLVGQWISLVALMTATVEYCEILRRRQQRRAVEAARREAADTGLQGLVRVLIAD
ncbi:MAG TPA: hypothetical protein VFK61_02115 [Candidatus Limnocylindria bacterium]|jgi:hypothetical protein|nr:hypothetical protein [Candidatus Limnocylindria bacterium]